MPLYKFTDLPKQSNEVNSLAAASLKLTVALGESNHIRGGHCHFDLQFKTS